MLYIILLSLSRQTDCSLTDNCNMHFYEGRAHVSGGQLTDCLRGGPGCTPGQFLWDLWFTKWHHDRIFSENFGFPYQYNLTNAPYSCINPLRSVYKLRK